MSGVNDTFSDEQIVQSKNDLVGRERELELNDLRVVLSTGEGRRFIWRLLAHCKVFGSIWSQSAAIHYYAGKQDVGHFVWAEIAAANEDAIFQMMTESRKANEARELALEAINSQGAHDV